MRPFNDYPEIELEVPCFSQRAVEALRALLEPNGELLPVESKFGEYFAYNILAKVEAPDLSRSKMEFFPSENRVAVGVDYFAFDKSHINDLSIFRLKEKWTYTRVTDSFRKRVEHAQLNGFLFSKVWPLKRGVN